MFGFGLRRTTPATVVAFLVLLFSFNAGAHEFWIEPLHFRVGADRNILANLKVGEDFKGDALVYLPDRVRGISIVDTDGPRPLNARAGDVPAFRVSPGPPGLHILAYYSTPSRLTYTEPGKFARFLEGKGLDWAIEEHRARGLPETGFTEAFSRCAKALVQTGGGMSGDDVFVGMRIEFVAQTNPYTLAPGQELPVMLLWEGAPLADAQVEVFRENDGLTTTKVRTGADGVARIPLADGGMFLLNAVHIIPWDAAPDDAWHSYWASLTFEIE